VVSVDVLDEEQKYFDAAWEAREASRCTLLQAGAASGGPKKVAAAVNRAAQEVIAKLGSPDEAVAFGRIDLGEETLYVGTRAITDDDMDLLVINWQAPAAQAFYEATVEAPLGVKLKRSFSCDRNQITDFADVVFADLAQRVANLTATPEETWGVDDVLLRDLESSRTGEMRDIVQTIQAAQYKLIRTPLDRLLVVQGGPGTGKTAVALHRISWLLYNHRDELSPEDVLVIGPNDTFTKYIRKVLPGLGDDQVEYRDLRSLGPQPSTGRNELTSVKTLKGEARMADLLRRGLEQRIRFPVGSSSLQIGPTHGGVDFTREEIEFALPDHRAKATYAAGRASFRAYLQREVERRAAPFVTITPQTLDNAVERVWPALTSSAFLRDLLGSRDRLLAAAEESFTAAEINRLFRSPSEKLSQEEWSDVDVALLDEAEALINGQPVSFGHVVVDEVQDLSPMQLRSIARRSRDGSMTVVGDLAQATMPWARDSWDEVVTPLRGEHEALIETLQFGYRVPKQLYEFAARLMPYAAPGIEPPVVIRTGPTNPQLVETSADDLAAAAVEAARQYAGSGRFVGLICPDRIRRSVENELTRLDVAWADVGAGHLDASINLARPSESKGLEFDAVVVVDPESIVGESDWGIRYLYIALTRTTRHLTVVHTGDPLALPAEGEPEDALIRVAEVRGLDQLPLFHAPVDPPRNAQSERNGNSSALRPASSVERPQPQFGRSSGEAETLQSRIAKSVAHDLAERIRSTVAPNLWVMVLEELNRDFSSSSSVDLP
jgi:hypothetical protein